MTVHPLGPILFRSVAARPAVARAVAAAVLAAALTLLGVASWLTPDSRGVGTHQQLGYPPCMSIILLGYPCPTCGMTTAFAHVMHGQPVSAFLTQPAGFALALLTILAVGLSLSTLLTGKVWAVNWVRVPPMRITLAFILLILFGWVFKIVAGVVSGTLPVGG